MGDPVAECGHCPYRETERNARQNPLESYARRKNAQRKNKKPDKMKNSSCRTCQKIVSRIETV